MSPMILERLAREAYRANMRRNSTSVTPIPAQTLVGPKVALIDKYSASDGDLFAHGFKALGIGKTIGTRTWGASLALLVHCLLWMVLTFEFLSSPPFQWTETG